MLSYGNRKQIERRLKERCRNDRARIQIGRISNFGLLEMSRQRLRESNVKWTIKLTNESFALKILKMAEIKALEKNVKLIDIKINDKIINFIENNFIEDLKYFENKNKVKINLISNKELNLTEYDIELKSKSKKILEKLENYEDLQKKILEKKEVNEKKLIKSKKIFKKNKFKKRKDFKKKIK